MAPRERPLRLVWATRCRPFAAIITRTIAARMISAATAGRRLAASFSLCQAFSSAPRVRDSASISRWDRIALGELGAHASDHLVGELGRAGVAAQVGVTLQ